ncbi:MAG: hypothetical protein GC190_11875 [Alphaproteobacteria bacterium]|nr:hypothetical protein [Alphaproteobacteria bacterium]
MSERETKGWTPLSRGERIAVTTLFATLALTAVGMLLAVTMATSRFSALAFIVADGILFVMCAAALVATLARIWWVRQPNRHEWRKQRAAGIAWLGAGLIYADARRHASATAQGRLRFISYIITAAGVLFTLYAGACTLGTTFLASLVIEPTPQGTPLEAFLLGLTAIVPATIIAGSLLYVGARLRRAPTP